MPANIDDFKNAASTSSMIYVARNKVLLVERGHPPYQGMWALPGGFNDFARQESLERTAVRELFEETNLRTLELVQLCHNSSPTRDPRGQVIDHLYVITKAEGNVRAKDDAKNFRYFSLNNLPKIAFDHGEVMELYKKMQPYLHLFPKINMADYARSLKDE